MKGIEKVRQVDKAYRHLFNTPEGQIILDDLAKHFGEINTAKDATPTSISVGAGELNVLNHILHRMNSHALD